VRTFAEHDREVVSKLYAVHKQDPDAHVLVSSELRDQLAHTLTEDEEATRTARPTPGPAGPG